jgi:hypothetical protein
MGFMKKVTLAEKTGQNWKVLLGLSLLHLGGISVLVASLVPAVRNAPVSLIGMMWFGGFGLAVGGLVTLTIGVKCPACKCRFLWWLMKKLPFEIYLDEGFWPSSCPRCGFDGTIGASSH